MRVQERSVHYIVCYFCDQTLNITRSINGKSFNYHTDYDRTIGGMSTNKTTSSSATASTSAPVMFADQSTEQRKLLVVQISHSIVDKLLRTLTVFINGVGDDDTPTTTTAVTDDAATGDFLRTYENIRTWVDSGIAKAKAVQKDNKVDEYRLAIVSDIAQHPTQLSQSADELATRKFYTAKRNVCPICFIEHDEGGDKSSSSSTPRPSSIVITTCCKSAICGGCFSFYKNPAHGTSLLCHVCYEKIDTPTNKKPSTKTSGGKKSGGETSCGGCGDIFSDILAEWTRDICGGGGGGGGGGKKLVPPPVKKTTKSITGMSNITTTAPTTAPTTATEPTTGPITAPTTAPTTATEPTTGPITAPTTAPTTTALTTTTSTTAPTTGPTTAPTTTTTTTTNSTTVLKKKKKKRRAKDYEEEINNKKQRR